MSETPELGLTADLLGYRLDRLEIRNWGPFHNDAWTVDLGGVDLLLWGENGSGKSTLVDAITTLLVPPSRLNYNRASGADKRDRALKTYVLGVYKRQTDTEGGEKQVARRDTNAYSVILAVFANRSKGKVTTAAQVFYFDSPDGDVKKIFAVADRPLSIREHFSDFGPTMGHLKKRLQGVCSTVVSDYPDYGRNLRRNFGLDPNNDRAFDLFNRAVSMKELSNLTNFIRNEMLAAFPVEEQIASLLRHHEDLDRAHAAILRAKAQADKLSPLVADADTYDANIVEEQTLVFTRDAINAWSAGVGAGLWAARRSQHEADLAKVEATLASAEERLRTISTQRDNLLVAIAENGGTRLDQIKQEIGRLARERDDRQKRAADYDLLAERIGWVAPVSAETFAVNRAAIPALTRQTQAAAATLEATRTAAAVQLNATRSQVNELTNEIADLKKRRSNIPASMMELRRELCAGVGLAETDLPFVGEMIQVRDDELAWEGAAERALRGFGLSIVYSDAHRRTVTAWVNDHHLRNRLICYPVAANADSDPKPSDPDSLARKIQIKPDADHFAWLERELSHRADLVCCDTMARFHKEKKALTKEGQLKGAGDRHEKDDRYRIDDRSRYVLGWSNEAKLETLTSHLEELHRALTKQEAAHKASVLEETRATQRVEALNHIASIDDFRLIDWAAAAAEIDDLQQERNALEAKSDRLKRLQEEFGETEKRRNDCKAQCDKLSGKRGQIQSEIATAEKALKKAEAQLDAFPQDMRDQWIPKVEAKRQEVLGARRLTTDNIEESASDIRAEIQRLHDALSKAQVRLVNRITSAMTDFLREYPTEATDIDASIEARAAYKRILEAIMQDDLPRFQADFKRKLNEGSIQEIVMFYSRLRGWTTEIADRIGEINRSLHGIDFNPGRYIALVPSDTRDADILQFRAEMKACAEGTLGGTDDEAYSEEKFLRLKALTDRLRGRDGFTAEDERWRNRVTDVRNWLTFSAVERRRSDDAEDEVYSGSSGKSGGETERLSYTVLAAGLAYQHGITTGTKDDQGFRFAIIDEAAEKGDDSVITYPMRLFKALGIQLLTVIPSSSKVPLVEKYVDAVAVVTNDKADKGGPSQIHNISMEEHMRRRQAAEGA